MGMAGRSGKAGDEAAAPGATGPEAPAPGTKKCAIVVGVDSYSEPSIPPLNYCLDDANGVADALGQHCDFEKPIVRLLDGTDASRRSVLEALVQLRDRRRYPDAGLIVFYFAGHGGTIRGKNYLIPHDGATGALAQDHSLPLARVVELLEQSGCPRKVLFIDACRRALGDGTRGPRTPGFNQKEADRAAKAARGLKIFFSTEFGQVAVERDDLQHGLFTHFLIEALSGRGQAVDNAGQVTVASLSSYLHTAMVGAVEGPVETAQVLRTAGDGSDGIVLASFTAVADERANLLRDLLSLAYRNLEQGESGNARIIFQALCRLDEGNPEVYVNLGHSAWNQGDFEAAQLAFDTALQLDSRNSQTHRSKAQLLVQNGEYEKALIIYDKVLSLSPDDAVAYYWKGMSLGLLGKYEEAIAACDQVIRLKPDDAHAHFEKAHSLAKLGRDKEAREERQKAEQLDPLLKNLKSKRRKRATISLKY